MSKTITKIKEDNYYSMQQIVSGKFFAWATSFWSVRKVVESDLKKKNVLKAIITGDGRAKKYQFKGSNIIKFITEVETGKVQL